MSDPQIFVSETAFGGSYLAVSVGRPRFCVGGSTPQEARAKAEQALAYWFSDSVQKKLKEIEGKTHGK